MLYLASFQLDHELEQMQRQGAGVVMVHADSLPDPLLRWIAWRARRSQLQPVAWIQRPTVTNLRRVGAVSGYQALQVDDHYFADPPVPIERLKSQLGGLRLIHAPQDRRDLAWIFVWKRFSRIWRNTKIPCAGII